jgi:ribosomal protein S13
LKTLYAAVTGSEADSDMSREEMLTKIAEIDQANKLAQNMEQYTATLENIAKGGVQLNEDTKSSVHDAKLIAGLLSDDGKGIDPDKAKEFIDKNGAFDRSKVDEIADTYFDGIDKWAEKVGKTTEELYDEIEKNIRDSQKINLNTY